MENRPVPLLDIVWGQLPTEDEVGQLLAAIDDLRPTAVEERPAGVRVYFASRAARDRAARLAEGTFSDIVCQAMDVAGEDWGARSQADLGDVQVGRLRIRLVREQPVRPNQPNQPNQPNHDDLAVLPSMGFGTGHHASTRRVLQLLQETPLAGRRVLDVGTGSGILAIAAWRLGAAGVLAVDVDPDALAAARASVALNPGASDAIHLREWDLETDTCVDHVDVITANLTGALLTRCATRLARLLNPGGTILTSGFEEDEAGGVIRAFVDAGCTLDRRSEELGWIALAFLPTPPRPEHRERDDGRRLGAERARTER